MYRKVVARMFCCLLVFSLAGCAVLVTPEFLAELEKSRQTREQAQEYVTNGQYDKAILVYENALSLPENVDPEDRSSIFFSLGEIYYKMGNLEKASEYYRKAIEIEPRVGKVGYSQLALIDYRKGDIEGAYENISKYKLLVDTSREHEEPGTFSSASLKDLMNVFTHLADVEKKRVHAQYDFYEMRLLDSNLDKQLKLKRYDKVIELAEKILNKKYRFWLGIDSDPTIEFIPQGSIADLSGLVEGDKLVEIDGFPVKPIGHDSDLARVEKIHRMLDIIGNVVDIKNIKIERKGRILTINCKLTYPEIEKARAIYHATRALVANKTAGKDTQAASLAILERESAASGNMVPPKVPAANGVAAGNPLDKIYDHRVAVVIGINKYNPWPSLEFAVNDAKSMRAKLADQAGPPH